ncbi:MAG TPA: type II secretion system F family protein [Mycobacteriales bacterium]|jgi:tight adherence protein B|nr:type II secretion system F family protein [Mycobacteriales bacterium]
MGWLAPVLLVLAGGAFVAYGVLAGRTAHRRRLAELLDLQLSTDGTATPATVSLYEKVARWTETRTQKLPWTERQTVRLERARIALRPHEFLLLWVGVGAGCALLGVVLLGLSGLVVLGTLGALAPPAVVAQRTRSWRRRFEAQLPDVLDLAASSMEAGHSLLTALQLVAEDADEPVGTELQRVLAETQVGRPLLDALDAMALRLGCPDFTWTVEGVRIQLEVGGRLAEMLRTLASFMRAREEVRRELRALVAEGKMSAYVLGALPVLMFLFMKFAAPAYIATLWTTGAGRVLLVVAVCLLGGAAAVMARIVRLEF